VIRQISLHGQRVWACHSVLFVTGQLFVLFLPNTYTLREAEHCGFCLPRGSTHEIFKKLAADQPCMAIGKTIVLQTEHGWDEANIFYFAICFCSIQSCWWTVVCLDGLRGQQCLSME